MANPKQHIDNANPNVLCKSCGGKILESIEFSAQSKFLESIEINSYRMY